MTKEGQEENALKHNIRTKGTSAYYYAHNRDFHVPDDAIVREGPGIITGGTPTLIRSAENESCDKEAFDKVEKYMIMEDCAENKKISIIIEFDEDAKAIEDVCLDATETSLSVIVKCEKRERRQRLHCNLYASIVPEKSKKRINHEKRKVTITLFKQTGMVWNSLIKTAP